MRVVASSRVTRTESALPSGLLVCLPLGLIFYDALPGRYRDPGET